MALELKNEKKYRIITSFVARLVIPAVVEVYYLFLKKNVLDSLRRQLVPAVFAFLVNTISKSLSSVQGAVSYPPILLRIKKNPATKSDVEDVPEKSVTTLVLAEPETEKTVRADIIFIHGLHGSTVNTWKQGVWHSERPHVDKVIIKNNCAVNNRISNDEHIKEDEKHAMKDEEENAASAGRFSITSCVELSVEEYSKCWPQDWLPKDCPGVRVITVNYSTDPYLWRPVWIKKRNRTCMKARSQEMIEDLLQLGVGANPIVWVGHSKGGLFVKQMIIDSWENGADNPPLQNLYKQTKAIMFYSVPHRGSSLADFNLPLLRQSVELTEIQRDCSFVRKQHDTFFNICKDGKFSAEIYSFIETSLTFMSIVYLRIVSYQSADPGLGTVCGVPLDHRNICKPVARDCLLYTELVNLINRNA